MYPSHHKGCEGVSVFFWHSPASDLSPSSDPGPRPRSPPQLPLSAKLAVGKPIRGWQLLLASPSLLPLLHVKIHRLFETHASAL